MGRTLLVRTNFGSTLVDEESQVYVRLGERYVRKLARDLQEEDIVVKHNEGLSIALEEAIPILEKRLGYRLARDALHERNGEGEYIPKLRTQLLRGLLGERASGLERVILREGDEFSPGERERFTENVMETGVSVQPSTVYNDWLRGRTLAPEEWENLGRLAAIHPWFREAYESKEHGDGFWAAYHLYTTVHRLAPGSLKQRGESEEGDAPVELAREQRIEGPFREYLQDLRAAFPGRVSREKEEAIVRRVEFVEKKRLDASVAREPAMLKRGLYTGPWDAPLTDVTELWETYNLLETAFQDMIEQYIERRFKVKDGKDVTLTLMNLLTSSYLDMRIRPSLTTERKHELELAGICAQLDLPKADALRACESVYRQFLREMESGEADRLFGAQPYTIAHLADVRREYRHALPQVLIDIEDMHGRSHFAAARANHPLGRDERRALEREREDIARRAKSLMARAHKDYGFTLEGKKGFLLTLHTNFLGRRGVLDEEVPRYMTRPHLRACVENARRDGFEVYTRAEVTQRLDRIGMKEVVKLYNPNNLVTESFP